MTAWKISCTVPAETTLPPLVLVGQEYWTDTVPVWSALRALAQGRDMAAVVHLVDTAEEATAIVLAGGTSR